MRREAAEGRADAGRRCTARTTRRRRASARAAKGVARPPALALPPATYAPTPKGDRAKDAATWPGGDAPPASFYPCASADRSAGFPPRRRGRGDDERRKEARGRRRWDGSLFPETQGGLRRAGGAPARRPARPAGPRRVPPQGPCHATADRAGANWRVRWRSLEVKGRKHRGTAGAGACLGRCGRSRLAASRCVRWWGGPKHARGSFVPIALPLAVD